MKKDRRESRESRILNVGVWHEDDPQSMVDDQTFVETEAGKVLVCGMRASSETQYIAVGKECVTPLAGKGDFLVIVHPGQTNSRINTCYHVDIKVLDYIAAGINSAGRGKGITARTDYKTLEVPARGEQAA